MAKSDDRGSHLQHLIYDLAVSLYSPYDVIHEQPIGNLGQRIDIFIPILGIAIEIDGIQHFKFVKFFFKDETAWYSSIRLDKKKEDFLSEHGVKLVRIPYDSKIKTKEELKEYIDSVPFPNVSYTPFSSTNEYKEHVVKEQREATKKYKTEKYKEENENAYQSFKDKRKSFYKNKKDAEKQALKEQKEKERRERYR